MNEALTKITTLHSIGTCSIPVWVDNVYDTSYYSLNCTRVTVLTFSSPQPHYASSSFLILRSGGSVLRSLLPPPLLDDGGSVLTLGLTGEVDGGGGGGKSNG